MRLFQLELEKYSVEKFKGAQLQLFMVPEEMKSIFMASKGMTLFTQNGPKVVMAPATIEAEKLAPPTVPSLEKKAT